MRFILLFAFIIFFARSEIYLNGTISSSVYSENQVIYIEKGTILKANVSSGVEIILYDSPTNTTHDLVLVQSKHMTRPFLIAPRIFKNQDPRIQLIITSRIGRVTLYHYLMDEGGPSLVSYDIIDYLNDSACTVNRPDAKIIDQTAVMMFPIKCNDRCLSNYFSSTLLPLLSAIFATAVTTLVVLYLNFNFGNNLPYHTRVNRTFCPIFIMSLLSCGVTILIEANSYFVFKSPSWWECPISYGGEEYQRRVVSLSVTPLFLGFIFVTVLVIWASFSFVLYKVPSQSDRSGWIFQMSPRERAAHYYALWMGFLVAYSLIIILTWFIHYTTDTRNDMILSIGICVILVFTQTITCLWLLVRFGQFCESRSMCNNCRCFHGYWLVAAFQHCDDDNKDEFSNLTDD